MWALNLSIFDGEKDSSIVTLNFDGTITVANMTTIALAAAGAVEDLIDGAVVKAIISQVVYQASSIAPDPLSDVEIKAKFIFDVANTVKNTIVSIPTFLRSKLIPGTHQVDTTDTDVATFLAFMEDGVALLGSPRDTENRDVTGLISAEEDYGRKRKK